MDGLKERRMSGCVAGQRDDWMGECMNTSASTALHRTPGPAQGDSATPYHRSHQALTMNIFFYQFPFPLSKSSSYLENDFYNPCDSCYKLKPTLGDLEAQVLHEVA